MAYAIQCCVRCSALEHGHTGPGDCYLCSTCYRAGFRVAAGGSLFQVERYTVHIWSSEREDWELALPKIEAPDPRNAYLAAKARHPGETVHVARILPEPCSPGGSVHA
jgi:hypothetical protein